jgi:hypothetical protein
LSRTGSIGPYKQNQLIGGGVGNVSIDINISQHNSNFIPQNGLHNMRIGGGPSIQQKNNSLA